MTTLFIAFHLLWKRKGANLILLLEVLLSIVSLSQAYVFVTDYRDSVRAVSELPQANAWVLNAFDYYQAEDMMQRLENEPLIAGIGQVRFGSVTCNQTVCQLAVYNSAMVVHYAPGLQSGSWLDAAADPDDGVLPAVVSADLRLKAGEKTQITMTGGRAYSIRVVGVLAEPTQYLYPTGSASLNYFSADMIVGKERAVIIREEDLAARTGSAVSSLTRTAGNLFLFTRPDAPESELASSLRAWNKYGEISRMDSLVDKFESNANTMIGSGNATFLVFLCLALTGVLSGNVIQSMRNQRTFTVYYLCGMNWKQGVAIEATRISILVLLMAALAALAGKVGLLMLEWMTPSRAAAFYGLTFAYIVLIFFGVSAGFLVRLTHTDISASLKDIRQGE